MVWDSMDEIGRFKRDPGEFADLISPAGVFMARLHLKNQWMRCFAYGLWVPFMHIAIQYDVYRIANGDSF